MNVAIIPARGGSKRIPRKNIKDFCGKPMIAWSIEAAIKSGCFDRVIVSTDDEEIGQVALAYGAEVPFSRPVSLSDDHCATVPVIQHAVRWLLHNNEKAVNICCIYATAPFVQVGDLRKGYAALIKEGCDYAFSVTSFPFPIQRALYQTKNKRVAMFEPENANVRSQDLTEAYHDAGQFYWGTSDAWLNGKKIFDEGAVPIVLPRHRVQDIDTHEDWVRAELLFKVMLDSDQSRLK